MKTKNNKKILYLTYDGLTDHIGESQILPYLIGCSKKGFQIHILSFEKKGRNEKIEKVQALLDKTNITWTKLNFTTGRNIFFKGFDILHFIFSALRLSAKNKYAIIHCRSYMAASVGYFVKKLFGVKLIFDKRDFWVDAQLETGRWKLTRFQDRIAYKMLRNIERKLFLHADHIVSLTENAKKIVLERYPSRKSGDITVIPCCADFNFYNQNSIHEERKQQLRRQLELRDEDFVLGYVGSLGVAYLQNEMMDFFKVLLEKKPSSKFLIVANNNHQFALEAAEKKGVPNDKIIITKATREEVPYYISLFDLSVFFYYTKFSRKACSPTRLAELFAMNVPAITNNGVGDMNEILVPEINHSTVVNDFTPAEYKNALSKVFSSLHSSPVNIRDNASYFDLNRGINLYANVYAILAQTDSSES